MTHRFQRQAAPPKPAPQNDDAQIEEIIEELEEAETGDNSAADGEQPIDELIGD
jgi:hypothetical protein